jgi:tRNA 2-thiouridine synthesizing protein B
MSTLHTVNKSPFTHNTLRSCLNICSDRDGILLLEDGVFGAITSSPCTAELQSLINRGVSVFVLEQDAKARGIEEKLVEGVQLTDYDKFVQLALDHRCVQSWY